MLWWLIFLVQFPSVCGAWCGMCSFPFTIFVVLLLFVQTGSLVPNLSSPLLLFLMWPSLHDWCGKHFLPVLSHFLCWLHWCGCYPGMSPDAVNLGSSYSAIFSEVQHKLILFKKINYHKHDFIPRNIKEISLQINQVIF